MTGSGKPQAAVLDIGKTNLKLVLVDPEGDCTASISRLHDFLLDEPYPAIDVDGIIDWFLDGLAGFAGRHQISALVTTAHGGGGVLVDEAGAVLPMMDYEAATPPEIDALYALEGPPYEEVFSFTGAGAMQLAKQLTWQAECFPQAFARAQHFLTTAQYVAWRLGGVPASEVSQLGAQGHVWNPRAGTLSNFVRRRGFSRLFPPLSRAGEVLGHLRPDWAARTGLARNTEVLCGVHDSNANLFRYKAAGLSDHTVLSTGTWMIGFDRRCPLDRLDGARAMVSNVDVDGEIVSSTLTMTGREYAMIAGSQPAPDDAAIAALRDLIARGTLPLPSFGPHDGLFPGSGRRGRFVGPPPAAVTEAGAAAALYVALTASACLDALGSRAPIVVDGGFSTNIAFGRLLAALRPGQPVALSQSPHGTALGAGLLWGRFSRTAPVKIPLLPSEPLVLPGLREAAVRWARLAAEPDPAALSA
ncbi:FGGY family carbohydrate kinase [Microvirga sesbaniae]|uniref:FGGY family carbohydrate kinase n=1 Tax=Microvirga sesbaniae TaxID=681392 RepID=UPI0021C9EB87|nr:FGGY family carbohydrate kinase [Microvirga sp. HBU67692]